MTRELLSPGAIADEELLAAGYGIPDDYRPELLARIRNGRWLDSQQFAPLRYHLPEVIPEGSTLLVGPPKIGKSWFVLALGLAAAGDGRALGLHVTARPVLYLALEDGDRRLQERSRLLLAGDPIPEPFEYITIVEPGMVLLTIRAWLARHPGADALVILDTLGRVMPPALMGESSYQRDYRIGAALKGLADEHPGVALLVNHHDRKAGSDDFVERVSGTNGLAGAADTIVVLARARHEQNGLLQVTGRDVPEGEYALTFDGTTGLWALDGGDLAAASKNARHRRATAGVGDRSAEIIAFVGEHPNGVRANEVEAELGEDARRYLARLAESGRLVRVERGVYALPSGLSQVSQCPNGTSAMGQRDSGDSPLGGPEPNDPTEPTPLPEANGRPSDDNREVWR